MTRPWTIRPYQPGDGRGILALFNAVFAEVDPNFRPRTEAHWRWQFEDNPLSHHTFVAIDPDGEVIGTYTAIPGTWLHDGAAMIGSQAVDTCVDREYRRVLKREGLFLSLARVWFDHYGRPERDRIVYGFPNPVAFRVGTKRLDYRPVHTPIRSLNRNFGRDWIEWLGPAGGDGVDVVEVDRFDPAVDDLFAATLGDRRLVQRRDARYLDWRYARCPTFAYRILEARAKPTGRLRGVTVLRTDRNDHVAPLVDWIVAGDDRDAFCGLARAAAECAAAAGKSCLETWVPPWSAHFASLKEAGFAEDDSTFNLCIRVFGPPFDEAWAKEHWFFTMGDSDVA